MVSFLCRQAEEWASREKREAEALQGRYDSTYSQAETQFQGSRSLLADIQVPSLKGASCTLQRDFAYQI